MSQHCNKTTRRTKSEKDHSSEKHRQARCFWCSGSFIQQIARTVKGKKMQSDGSILSQAVHCQVLNISGSVLHLHLHLSLECEGLWGTTDYFTTTFLHFSQFSTALWDLANSRLVHSLMLSFHLFCPSVLTSSSFHCTLQDGFG